ncbi:hypothetical protein [uncultured Legionella sp.]|uniref:hypothetical protein n=1 Tax=uncultured Legionella sp. TaxID=210934 RepID=UPI00262BAA52|nr:hypothetical protein [uncultured Legionella sp.]
MKTIILFIVMLIPYQLQASACKCNCNFGDFSLCARSYDIEHPCPGVCPSAAVGLAPMKTACQPIEVFNPIKQMQELKVICHE